MERKIYSPETGKEVGTINLSDDVFGIEVSTGSIYYAIRNEETNRRVGTACTKTRSEVNYSNNKPYRQKGTGSARRGDKKSPLAVGGGTVFGPKPKDYTYSMPKKQKRLAIKSLLTLGVQEDRLIVVEDFTSKEGKTKDMVKVLKALSTDDQRTLMILPENDLLLRRACGNIKKLHVLQYNNLNARELMFGKKIIVLKSAAENLNEFYKER